MMATEKENMAMTAETREQKPSMATCKEALADYRRIYLPVPAIEDRKPVFLSKEKTSSAATWKYMRRK